MDPVAEALLDATDAAVQVVCVDGRVLGRNRAWSAVVEPTAGLDADAWLALVPVADRQRLSAELQSAAPDRQVRLPVRLMAADGHVRWWTVTRTPVVQDGRVRAWAEALVPAPDRADPGDVAWRERDVLAQAQRVAQMGAWDWDVQSGGLWWSDEVYRIFGMAPQEFPATYEAFLERVHPDDRAEVQRRVTAAVEGTEEYDLRHRIVRTDGTLRYVREQGSVTWAPDGLPVRMLGTVLDVTKETEHDQARDQALQALAESETRLRLLAENSSDFITLARSDGRLEWVSDSVARVLGWAPQDLVGHSGDDIVHPEDLPSAVDGDGTESRLRVRRADGTYLWVSRILRTVTDETGEPVAYVCGFRDVEAEVGAQRQADEARAAAEAGGRRLRAAIEAMLDPHVLLEAVRDDAGTIVDFVHIEANAAAEAHTRSLGETLVGRRLLDVTPGQAAAGLLDMYARVVETGEPLVLDAVPYADEAMGGQVRRFDMRGVRVGDAISLTFRDVTDREVTARALEASEARYRLLAENASDVVMQLAPDGRVVWVSESVTRVLGYRPAELIGADRVLAHPDDMARAVSSRGDAQLGTEVHTQYRVPAADGTYRYMAMTSRPVPTAEGVARVVAMRDIEDEVVARSALEHALGHDALTGLANRENTLARLEALLERSSVGPRRLVGVLCVAIDLLGDLVNALGHGAGDRLITTVVTRLVGTVGDSDRVGRGSGNEFFVLLPDLATPADAAVVAESIRAAVRGPVPVQGEVLDPTVCIGIATGVPGDDAERLLRDASLAMRQAKARGRDRDAFADPDQASGARDRLALEAEIRRGLVEGEFIPWYQPIVAIADGSLAGYEALVRWVRADGTIVAPGGFLPVAESTGLVTDLDLAVLDQAVRCLSTLPAPVTVAVNAAADTLAVPDFPARVLDRLADTGVDPGRLHLEVTETTLLTLSDRVQDTIRSLADAGVRWYVDDFGTGYSSISHLRDLPIDGLKLDRSFTADCLTNATSRKLAAGLAALATSLNLDTVAEGVETRQQAALMRQQGWFHGQGWLFGRPAPLAGVGALAAGRP